MPDLRPTTIYVNDGEARLIDPELAFHGSDAPPPHAALLKCGGCSYKSVVPISDAQLRAGPEALSDAAVRDGWQAKPVVRCPYCLGRKPRPFGGSAEPYPRKEG